MNKQQLRYRTIDCLLRIVSCIDDAIEDCIYRSGYQSGFLSDAARIEICTMRALLYTAFLFTGNVS